MKLTSKTKYIIKMDSAEIKVLSAVLAEYVLGETYETHDRSRLFNTHLQRLQHLVATRKVIT